MVTSSHEFPGRSKMSKNGACCVYPTSTTSGTTHDNAPLLAAQSGDHGHSHDDPQADDDRSAGHQHGNHTTDHSHDKSNLPRSGVHAAMKLPDIWGTAPRTLAYSEPYFSFERPPKSLLMS